MWVFPNIDFIELSPLDSDQHSENSDNLINNDFEIDYILYLQTIL